ncbi:MAG TPA: hypothetical protein VGO58_16165 [Chitinophagaceae bacterium]|jgi:hypothetical protein|nr:hypothetical protein [Chitinophagaceae bacterium]
MAKTPSYDLFTLIRSLNKNEKGYIKKFSFTQRHEHSSFLKLFDAIERQAAYDEKALNKDKYIAQLPRMKSYLYEHILAALGSYYSRKDPGQIIRRIIGYVYVLFEKGLYDQCKKQLYKAKQLARQYEKFGQLIELIEWEDEVLVEKLLLQDVESHLLQKEMVLGQISNIAFYRKAFEQVSKLYAEIIYTRTAADEKEFSRIISNKMFSNEKMATSISSRVLFYKTLAKYYAATDDKDNYLLVMSKAVQLTEAHPLYFRHHVMHHIKLLNNLLATLSEHYDDPAYNRHYKRLKKIGEQDKSKSPTKTKIIVSMRLMIRDYFQAFNKEQFDEAYRISRDMEKMLQERQHLLSEVHQVMFMYQIAYISFIHKDLKRTLTWTSRIIGFSYSPDKIFFLCQARLLQLVIQVELGNTIVIPSMLKSTIRFFQKYRRVHTLEKFFFAFLSSFVKASDNNTNVLLSYAIFKKQLTDELPAQDIKMFDYFHFPAWCNSKLKKTDFSTSLKKQ